jgi:hypothetical protein
MTFFPFLLLLLWDWGLNSGLHTCEAGVLSSLRHTSKAIFLWSFWRWGLEDYLPGLALNLDPPNFSQPSNKDYR